MSKNETIENTYPTYFFGDFGRVTEYIRKEREEFIRRLGIEPGRRVLELGCGPAPETDEAAVTEASDLPFPDESFDAVVSVFGAMFAPRPDLVAAEMHRVCRPGGLIAMANWTPDGLVGQMFRLAMRYAPSAMYWPFQWGRAPWVRMCFGDAVESVEFALRSARMEFPFPVAAVVDFWLTYCTPLAEIFRPLGPEARTDLRLDLEWLLSGHNVSTDDGMTVIEAEYLEVRGTRPRAALTFDDSACAIDLSNSHPTLSAAG